MNDLISKICLGKVNGKEAFWDVNCSQNSHVALVGGSGGGKSVQMQKIIAEVAEGGGTVLVIDFHGSFADDQIFPLYKGLIDDKRNDIDVYSTGIPYHLFDSLVFSDKTTEMVADTVGAITDVLCRAYKLGVNQRTALRMAIQQVMSNGEYVDEGFRAVGEALLRNGDKISLVLYERMLPLFEHNVFRDGNGFILNSRINVLKLGKLDLETQEVITEIVLSQLWRLGNADQFKATPIFVCLDEIQNLSTAGKSPLALLISEGRRMGINLVMATQMILNNTTNAVQQRISQAGLLLFFKPPANRVVMTAKMINSSYEHYWSGVLSELTVGEFVAVGNLLMGSRQISYPLKVSAYEGETFAKEAKQSMNVYGGRGTIPVVNKI